MSVAQALCLVLVVLVMGGSVWLGLKEGLDGLRDAQGMGQRVAAGFQVLYGLAAILGLVALFVRPGWARFAFGVWAGALVAGVRPASSQAWCAGVPLLTCG